MSKQVPFHITSGLPFSKTIEVVLPNGRVWWTDDTQFEVLSQVREGQDDSSPLIIDLAPYIAVVWAAPDTATLTLTLSGAETRLVTKSGYYDIVLSDPLPTDDRAIKIIGGPVVRNSLVTADTGVV